MIKKALTRKHKRLTIKEKRYKSKENKDYGFHGPLSFTDKKGKKKVSTELSRSNKKETKHHPLLSKSMTKKEQDTIVKALRDGKKIPSKLEKKAEADAKARKKFGAKVNKQFKTPKLKKGKNSFANTQKEIAYTGRKGRKVK
jgi:hypothetical protein